RYDPARDELRLLGNLGEIVGEAGGKTVAQGKTHTPFFENEGKLYFSTHVGHYETDADGRENPGCVPAGYEAYPGGHFVEYDMVTERFRALARAPDGEGIITCALDQGRRRLYGLSWPRGLFFYYDLDKQTMRVLGPACGA